MSRDGGHAQRPAQFCHVPFHAASSELLIDLFLHHLNVWSVTRPAETGTVKFQPLKSLGGGGWVGAVLVGFCVGEPCGYVAELAAGFYITSR